MSRNPCRKCPTSRAFICFDFLTRRTRCQPDPYNARRISPMANSKRLKSVTAPVTAVSCLVAICECSGSAFKTHPPCNIQITGDARDSRVSANTILAGPSRWRRAQLSLFFVGSKTQSVLAFHSSSASRGHCSSNQCSRIHSNKRSFPVSIKRFI